MPKKASVEYVKQSVPAFLQRFKEETGYKEHLISDKLGEIDQDKELEDREEERPQVVQLSKNDLTAEEAKKHWDSEEKKIEEKEEEAAEDDNEAANGKVMFRKPAKRPSDGELDFNVRKKSKQLEKGKTKEKKKKKGVNNVKLLSFNDEDDET